MTDHHSISIDPQILIWQAQALLVRGSPYLSGDQERGGSRWTVLGLVIANAMPQLNKHDEENYLEYVKENIHARSVEKEALLETAREGAVDNKAGQALRNNFRETPLPDADSPYFMRVDLTNGETRYYGGIKLNHILKSPLPASHSSVVDGLLILSSSSDGVGYIGDYPENLPDLAGRARYTITDGKLIKFDEEDLKATGTQRRVLAKEIVADNLHQTREKNMKPITATLQPDQFKITREPISHSLAIQGPPGSGKTAVLLERLARIAYADQNVAKKGMLLIGPNKPFMDYVSHVLPSLGETGISLLSIDEISDYSKKVNSPVIESDELIFLKGSDFFRDALRELVASQIRILPKTYQLRVAEIALEFTPADSYRLVQQLLEENELNYSYLRKLAEVQIRNILIERLENKWRSSRGDIRTMPGDPAQLITQESTFRTIVRNIFPNIDPVSLLGKMKSDATFFSELKNEDFPDSEFLAWIEESEHTATKITPVDVPILDYLDFLMNDPVQKWGHIAIDEAQDLTPLEFAMVARRLDSSATVSLAGDLAQATGAHYYSDWAGILSELDQEAGSSLRELHTSYRVPAEVIKYAHQFLEITGVQVAPSETFLEDPNSLQSLVISEPSQRLRKTISTAQEFLTDGESVLIIAASDDRMKIKNETFTPSGKAYVSILDPKDVKGLEFDHVIILNPDDIAHELAWNVDRAARLFYVLTTRSTKSLLLIGQNSDVIENPLLGLDLPSEQYEETPTETVEEVIGDVFHLTNDDDSNFEEAEVTRERLIDDLLDEAEEMNVEDEEFENLDLSLEDVSILELCQRLNVNINQASGEYLIGQWLFAGNGRVRCTECREKPQLVFLKHQYIKGGREVSNHRFAIACKSCALIRDYNLEDFGPIEEVIDGLGIQGLLNRECEGCVV